MSLAETFPPRLTVICLRAPRRCPFGGFAWFDIEFQESEKVLDGQQALETLRELVPTLRDIAQEFDVPKLILGGFSQGAMMSFGVLQTEPDLLRAAILLSGCPIDEFEKVSVVSATIPVLIHHGLHDEVVPILGGRELARLCTESGADVSYREYAMGHQISAESFADLNNWLESI